MRRKERRLPEVVGDETKVAEEVAGGEKPEEEAICSYPAIHVGFAVWLGALRTSWAGSPRGSPARWPLAGSSAARTASNYLPGTLEAEHQRVHVHHLVVSHPWPSASAGKCGSQAQVC